MRECNKPFCSKLNWVQDDQNANHYTCLKCDRELRVNTFHWGSFVEVLFQIVGVLFLLIVLMGCDSTSQGDRADLHPKLDPSNGKTSGDEII